MISEKTNFLILTTVRNITGGFATLQQFASDISDLGSVEQYSLVQHYSNSSRLLIKVPFLQKYLLLITSCQKFLNISPHFQEVIHIIILFLPISPLWLLLICFISLPLSFYYIIRSKGMAFFPVLILCGSSHICFFDFTLDGLSIYFVLHIRYDFYATIPKLPHLASALTYIYPALVT